MENNDLNENPESIEAKLPEPTFVTSPVKKKSAKDKDELVGGFAFFLSLGALLPSGALLLGLSLFNVRPIQMQATGIFAAAWFVGILLGHSMIRGHLSVLLHEFKHSLISNLVGNKRKGMQINENSGHFEYSYTKKTAHFNAFISLAPYIVPIFTFIGMLASLGLFRDEHFMACLLVGLCYGVDTILNIRDISPIQTDINQIRGGYGIGLLYIFAWNLITAALLTAWVFQGGAGILMLLEQVTAALMHIYLLISSSRTTN